MSTPVAASITLSPSSLSLNEGQVSSFTATALNSSGTVVAVDYTYSSSNSALASISAAGLICGGQFDSNSIVCSPNGDGQATITVTSGSVSATATVYVHKQVDRVVVTPYSDCSKRWEPRLARRLPPTTLRRRVVRSLHLAILPPR